MGTNYYFRSKNKAFVKKYFDMDYELVDEPYFCYEIHICKLSAGWTPLFQIHDPFHTFDKLVEFYNENWSDIIICDEYDDEYSMSEFRDIIINHSHQERIPYVLKDGLFIDCSEEEADIFTPFLHSEFQELERKNHRLIYEEKYYKDDKYNIEWMNGDFG